MDAADHSELPKIACPHCKRFGEGKLCSECGETLQPRRITFGRIIRDIPDVFFDLEYGLLYTIRTFLSRPGTEIKEYFKGDRQKHYKPLKFVLFIGGLVTFLIVTFDIHDGKEMSRFDKFGWQWNSAILLMQFPMISFFTWLFFRSRKYNFGEHLIANAYIITEVTLYLVVFFPLYLMFNKTFGVSILHAFYLFWIIGYYTYVFYDWFYNKQTTAGFFKSLGVVIFIFIITTFAVYPFQILLYVAVLKVNAWLQTIMN